jgi:mono/diheme cytochrome c family protein
MPANLHTALWQRKKQERRREMRGIAGLWKRVLGLTTTVLLLGVACLAVVAAEEEESRFGNLHKGPDRLYHWEEKPEEEDETAVLARGKEEFKTYCASCHGLTAKGDGPMADQLKKAPADLTQLATKKEGEFPFWDTYTMIDGRKAIAAHGGREMPVWGAEFKEEVPVRAAGPRWVLEAQEGKAEAVVKDRILRLVLYLQSIQGS